MQLQLTNFEQAAALKAAGFDWEVTDYFHTEYDVCETGEYDNYNSDNNTISRPTVALALKWLREVKGVRVSMQDDYDYMLGYLRGWIPSINGIAVYTDGDCFPTHDLSETAALTASLKMIQNGL